MVDKRRRRGRQRSADQPRVMFAGPGRLAPTFLISEPAVEFVVFNQVALCNRVDPSMDYFLSALFVVYLLYLAASAVMGQQRATGRRCLFICELMPMAALLAMASFVFGAAGVVRKIEVAKDYQHLYILPNLSNIKMKVK